MRKPGQDAAYSDPEPTYEEVLHQPFMWAAAMGNIDSMKSILNSNPQIYPRFNNNQALALACQHRRLSAIKFILQLSDVNSSDPSNPCVLHLFHGDESHGRRFLDIATCLAGCEQLDFSVSGNFALQNAVYYRLNPKRQDWELDLVKLVILDKRVDPSVNGNKMLKLAIEKHDWELVRVLS